MELSQVLFFAIPVFFVAILAEFLYARRKKIVLYSWPDLWSNIKAAMLAATLKSLALTFYVVLYYQAYERLMPVRQALFGYASVGYASYWWLIGVLLDDLGFYWYHRLSHQVRAFWACHVVHHSSDHFNLSVGLRNSGLAPFYEPLFYLILPVLGFHPVMTLACRGINNVYQFFCHTQLKTPWDKLEPFLVTPRLHEVHHGTNEACIDMNYAGIFCFYDQIFGTYQPSELMEEIRYGVTNPPPSRGVVDINLHEWRDISHDVRKQPTWRRKLAVLFNGPSWKPESTEPKTKSRSRNGSLLKRLSPLGSSRRIAG
jgi:sterol desaturase/sphingolipid hydroxylase (fatty acid hydroxylase superfamily)